MGFYKRMYACSQINLPSYRMLSLLLILIKWFRKRGITWSIYQLFIYFVIFFFPYSKCGHELMPKANEREREKEWGRRKKIIESLPTMKSYSKRDPNLDIQACNTRCNMYVKWLHFPPILYAYTHTMLLPKSKALELLKNSIILQFKPFSLGVFLSP